MVDYHVVPEALRKNSKEYFEIADAWTNARNSLSDAHMGPDDVGLLGKEAGVPRSHNSALNSVLGRLTQGFEALNNASLTLRAIADEYESREAQYYRKFGYIDERLGH
ncbi:hypothetical protein ACOBQX_10575 [Actinokineospora sp. G85]|uniref:hypothetical protein n=1 Tax=Actinokineospora sp. G85 TaxID=3406626 RepID=UPI003C74EF11